MKKLFLLSLFFSFSSMTNVFASGVILSKGESTIVGGVAVSCEAPLLTLGKYTTTCKTDSEDRIKTIKIDFIADVNASNDELLKNRNDYLESKGILKSVYWCDSSIYGPTLAN